MHRMLHSFSVAAALTAAILLPPGAASGEDAAAEAAIQDIEKTWGFVPGFVRTVPPSALPGAWAELKGMESGDTALTAKEKALIAIGVAAQIPCQYCVWLDTRSAYLAGATDQEVREAVAMAALVRHWSTILHGNQIDLATLQEEFAEFDKAAQDARAKTMAAQ